MTIIQAPVAQVSRAGRVRIGPVAWYANTSGVRLTAGKAYRLTIDEKTQAIVKVDQRVSTKQEEIGLCYAEIERLPGDTRPYRR